MKAIFQEVINTEILWEKCPGPYFQADYKEKLLTLRLNDFPDEVLLTLIIDGDEQDLEETPKSWKIPPSAGQQR